MGIRLFKVSSSSFDFRSNKIPELPNPDPKNFNLIRKKEIGNFLILMINYPDCKNYEGNKILVFEDVKYIKIYEQGVIDPHFSDNKDFHSPIARFEPTDKGWKRAIEFCNMLNG